MEPFSLGVIATTFFAGVLTFFLPCTFPLIPGFLSFISGSSVADLQDPAKVKKIRSKIVLNGILYVVGFSSIFIFLGSLFGLGGQSLFQYRDELIKIGGVIVMAFGFLLLAPAITGVTDGKVNLVRLPILRFFSQERKVPMGRALTPGKPLSSLLFGASFGMGWSPCAGPIVGFALTQAAASATVVSGAALLGVFSAGLGSLFIASAYFVGWATLHFKRFFRALNWISLFGSILLIALGYLMFTGQFVILNGILFEFLDVVGLGSIEAILLDSL
jgi:cytochrome c-type biogenesis protein